MRPTSAIMYLFWRALRLASLCRVRFHDLRHSFASLLIEQGEDLYYIKEQLGHHSITLTVDVYGHRFKDDRRAVDGLDEWANGSKMVAAQAVSASDGALVANFPQPHIVDSMGFNSGKVGWCAWRDLNPQPSDPKSDALSN